MSLGLVTASGLGARDGGGSRSGESGDASPAGPAAPGDDPALAARGPASAEGAAPAGEDAPGVSVEWLSGSGTYPLADLDWRLSEDGKRLEIGGAAISLDEVLFLKFSNPPLASTPESLLELRSGDLLAGAIAGGGADAVSMKSAALGGETIDTSLDHVRSLAIPGAFSDATALADFRARKLAESSPADRLYLRSGAPLTGIVESIGSEGIRFTAENLGEILYPYDKLRAIRLADFPGESDDEPAPGNGLTTVVQLVDGGALSGTLESLEKDTLVLDHPVFGSLRIRLASLLQVSFRGGRCVFLSDTEPSSVNEHLGALFRATLPHRKDRSVMGTPLRIAERTYAKGLGVHAYSLLEFRLDGEFQRFQATIGLDETARPEPGSSRDTGGEVVFRVYLDKKKLGEWPLDYDDPPQPIDLDVSEGEVLGLEVDFGKDEFNLARDRANWADARVIR